MFPNRLLQTKHFTATSVGNHLQERHRSKDTFGFTTVINPLHALSVERPSTRNRSCRGTCWYTAAQNPFSVSCVKNLSLKRLLWNGTTRHTPTKSRTNVRSVERHSAWKNIYRSIFSSIPVRNLTNAKCANAPSLIQPLAKDTRQPMKTDRNLCARRVVRLSRMSAQWNSIISNANLFLFQSTHEIPCYNIFQSAKFHNVKNL